VCSRRGEFQTVILTMLRNQEEESTRLIGSRYPKGLTTLQVSEIFEEIYGKNYSKSGISRMLDNIREEVDQWICQRTRSSLTALVNYLDVPGVRIHVTQLFPNQGNLPPSRVQLQQFF